MNRITSQRIAAIREEIRRRRRAGKPFDDEAATLAALLDENASIRGVKESPVARLKTIK